MYSLGILLFLLISIAFFYRSVKREKQGLSIVWFFLMCINAWNFFGSLR